MFIWFIYYKVLMLIRVYTKKRRPSIVYNNVLILFIWPIMTGYFKSILQLCEEKKQQQKNIKTQGHVFGPQGVRNTPNPQLWYCTTHSHFGADELMNLCPAINAVSNFFWSLILFTAVLQIHIMENFKPFWTRASNNTISIPRAWNDTCITLPQLTIQFR